MMVEKLNDYFKLGSKSWHSTRKSRGGGRGKFLENLQAEVKLGTIEGKKNI